MFPRPSLGAAAILAALIEEAKQARLRPLPVEPVVWGEKPKPLPTAPRNARCPCGSGKKWKACGRLGRCVNPRSP
jgi:uncharacterized protein YecA (UPF0149 family)